MIVVFAPFPRSHYAKDGYLRRVESIDALIQDSDRLYVEFLHTDDPGAFTIYRPSARVLEVRCPLSEWPAFEKFLEFSDVLYAHSVYSIEPIFESFKESPVLCKKLVLDFHGAVSVEEGEKPGNQARAERFAQMERFFAQNATTVTVSHAMTRFFSAREGLPNFQVPVLSTVLTSGKPAIAERDPRLFLYAGGSQAWQGLSDMERMLRESPAEYHFQFLSPDRKAFEALKESSLRPANVRVEMRDGPALLEAYSKASFGLLLRKDSPVNEVACPTKLLEYLTFGLIPVLNSTKIGDLASWGVQYLSLADAILGNLPDAATQERMRTENAAVARRVVDESLRAMASLGKFLTESEKRNGDRSLTTELGLLVLHNFRVGRAATHKTVALLATLWHRLGKKLKL